MPKRLLFIGGESSGKTTLCKTLSQIFGLPWVSEYGRDLYEQRDGKLVYEDMLNIARVQVEKEKIAMVCTREQWIFCDTSPLVTKFYSQELFGKVDPNLEQLADRRYDDVFLCVRDFPFVNDGTRVSDEFSRRQEEFYRQNLKQPFYVITGSIEHRVNQVRKAM